MLVRGLFVVAAIVLAGGGARAEDAPAPCRFEPIGGARVATVLDERTLRLTDGREVRLAGLAPLALPPAKAPNPRRAAEAAKADLSASALGKDVRLQRFGAEHDRYGRTVAYVFADEKDSASSLQQALLAHGHGLAADRFPDRACAASFLAAEQTARAAKLGLWADPYYDIRQADDPAAISAERGRFAIVEGRVLSVRASGGTIYVNFGRRWSEDFTVTILKRNERTFIAAGIEPKTLAGHRIRIRGWVDERGGPWIEAARPEQIERADRHSDRH